MIARGCLHLFSTVASAYQRSDRSCSNIIPTATQIFARTFSSDVESPQKTAMSLGEYRQKCSISFEQYAEKHKMYVDGDERRSTEEKLREAYDSYTIRSHKVYVEKLFKTAISKDLLKMIRPNSPNVESPEKTPMSLEEYKQKCSISFKQYAEKHKMYVLGDAQGSAEEKLCKAYDYYTIVSHKVYLDKLFKTAMSFEEYTQKCTSSFDQYAEGVKGIVKSDAQGSAEYKLRVGYDMYTRLCYNAYLDKIFPPPNPFII